MQTKLLCSLLLLTGISVCASETSNEVETVVRAIKCCSASRVSLVFFAQLDALSRPVRPTEAITSKSGNTIPTRSLKTETT